MMTFITTIEFKFIHLELDLTYATFIYIKTYQETWIDLKIKILKAETVDYLGLTHRVDTLAEHLCHQTTEGLRELAFDPL